MGCLQLPLFDRTRKSRSDGSECQSPETTHFWQGRRLGQTNKIQINKWLRPQAAYVSLCKESNQRSSGAECKMMHNITKQCKWNTTQWNNQTISSAKPHKYHKGMEMQNQTTFNTEKVPEPSNHNYHSGIGVCTCITMYFAERIQVIGWDDMSEEWSTEERLWS